jgi:hypothetical protein
VGADDFSRKPVFDELGHSSDMVDVGVGDEQVVDPVRWYRPLVHAHYPVAALGHPAVHHQVQAVDLQEVAGTGDAVFGAEMG